MSKISIALPIHNMDNAPFFLRRCLDSIKSQFFVDYEVVITDNSPNDELEKVIKEYNIPIRYARNERNLGMAGNINKAIRFCDGEIIKVLFMDDYLAHRSVLRQTYNAFDSKKLYWIATACEHAYKDGIRINKHMPMYNDKIHTGFNTIGSPSVIAFRNKDPLFFDESMTWLLDCDYYKRLYERNGAPKLLDKVHVIIGLGDHQITNILSDVEKQKEHEYIANKYKDL